MTSIEHEKIPASSRPGILESNTADAAEPEGRVSVDDNNDGGNDDDANHEVDGACFCTFAVTGPTPCFQAIFVCNECFRDEPASSPSAAASSSSSSSSYDPTRLETTNDTSSSSSTQHRLHPSETPQTRGVTPLCICQACADSCHQDNYHDVEYIGMGPAYCDCNHKGQCKIVQTSLQEAKRLGITRTFHEEENINSFRHSVRDKGGDEEKPSSIPTMGTTSGPPLIQEVYEIPFLQEPTSADLFVRQAQELVRHTKDSHWVDETIMNNSTTEQVSGLESLAWNIYRSHRLRYEGLFSNGGDGGGGAEWWVQIKDVPSNGNDEQNIIQGQADATTIGLHYDKDEALAESFGIGSFPTLSTVTYLSPADSHAAPTLVFDHTYSQGEDEVMHTMLVSRPSRGKHLVFDGRLLHGAPAHLYLQPLEVIEEVTGKDDSKIYAQAANENDTSLQRLRVTFLVNIWRDRRPANVHCLDEQIRQQLVPWVVTDSPRSESSKEDALMMTPLTIPTRVLESEKDLPEILRRRIELPFVTDDSDEDGGDQPGGGSVVVTFPPPPNFDTVTVSFGPGMQAYMDYSTMNEVEDGLTPVNFISKAQQSDYV